MAVILGTQTVDSINIINTDVNPSLGGGTPAPIGSIISASDGSGLYYKAGALDTDYTQVPVSPSQVTSATLTGFVVGVNTPITDTDTILSAFGVVQGQLNNKQNALGYTPVNIAGDTMTGSLILNADATNVLGAVTLQQLNSAITGVYKLQGGYDASTNLFPTASDTTNPVSATVKRGMLWVITVAGTLGGQAVQSGDTVLALVDSPAQIASNWNIQEYNQGYTPLSDVLNSANIFVGNASNVATGVSVGGVLSVDNTGVFSYVNSSLDLASKVTGVLPIANGGTNSAVALTNSKVLVSVGGAIVENPNGNLSTSHIVVTGSTNNFPKTNASIRWNDTAGTMGLGASGGASDRLTITATGTMRGAFVNASAIAGLFGTTSTTEVAMDLSNNSGVAGAVGVVSYTKAGGGAGAIGDGLLQSWSLKVPTNAVVNRFGVVATDVTAGTYKTKFVWQTPNQIDGTIVDRMALTSNGVLQILGSIISTGYVSYKQLPNIVNSNTIVSTTAETLFTGVGITLSVPANTLGIGDRIKVTFRGIYSRTSGSLTSRLKNNAVTMLTAPAITLTSNTNLGFVHEAIITILTIGVGGTCRANFETRFDDTPIPDGRIVASNGTLPINTTILQLFTFSEQWSISAVANTITTENADWEILKAT